MRKTDDSYKTKLSGCDLKECKGMCCYDGIYLLDGEERYLKEIVAEYKDFFEFLPEEFITRDNWKNVVVGQKTAVRKYDGYNKNFPEHFEKTKCVFAFEDGRCSLQTLAEELGIHKWTFKPTGCWMFPLDTINGKIFPSPVTHAEDPDMIAGDYPGFHTYTECGKHKEDGSPWQESLEEEVSHLQRLPQLPFWPNLKKPVKEIVENNSELLAKLGLK